MEKIRRVGIVGIVWFLSGFALGQNTTYQFQGGIVSITGGFWGGYQGGGPVEGTFRLAVDKSAGTARFVGVNAFYSDFERGDVDLGKLFNMTGMVGTVVSDSQIEFTGLTKYPFDGAKFQVHLQLTVLQGNRVQLKGSFPPYGTCCDLYTYELDALAGQVPCNYRLAGDLNDDCRVDIADLAILAANWLYDCTLHPDNPPCVPK